MAAYRLDLIACEAKGNFVEGKKYKGLNLGSSCTLDFKAFPLSFKTTGMASCNAIVDFVLEFEFDHDSSKWVDSKVTSVLAQWAPLIREVALDFIKLACVANDDGI
jgi:hypothetical protein